jgi:urea transport system permease protein
VIRAIPDERARGRFPGYSVKRYKLFLFTLSAVIAAIARALCYPRAGIINPRRLVFRSPKHAANRRVRGLALE